MKDSNTHALFIGIGAQKSATSWLFKMLQQHPEISVADEKEVHFFSDDEKFKKGKEWYEEKLGSGKGRGEISTSYLSSEKTPQRIEELYPDARIIVILRDPVERAVSHIQHLISKSEITGEEPLDEVLKKYPQIIENGMYGKHLSTWFSFFSEENILIIFYEDIKSAPEAVLQNTYKFLGVDSSYTPKVVHQSYNSSIVRLNKLHGLVNTIYLFLLKRKWGRIIINTIKKTGMSAMILEKIITFLSFQNRVLVSNNNLPQLLFDAYKKDLMELRKLLNNNHIEKWLSQGNEIKQARK